MARATGAVPESFTVTVAQPERLAEQAQKMDDAKLVGAIDSLSAAVAAMREGDDPRLTLEVALLKVAMPSLDSSREALAAPHRVAGVPVDWRRARGVVLSRRGQRWGRR